MTGRTVVAALAALACLAALTAIPADAAPAQAPPTVTSTAVAAAPTGPRMTVRRQDFEVEPNGRFDVRVAVAEAPAGSDLLVDIYPRIESQEDLAASATDRPGGSIGTFDPIPLSDQPTATPQTPAFTIYLFSDGDPLPPDVPRPWVFELDEPGVYPVRIRLRDASGEPLATIVTYLVRQPGAGQAVTPVDVALVTSVHQPPATEPDQPIDASYRDDLDAVLGAFAARPDLPAAFAVTPETAARLDADPEAADTLADLKAQIAPADRTLLGAPYVDIDPASLVAGGLASELAPQADLGRATLTRTLGATTDDTWLADHPLDAEAVGALHRLGVAHLVVPGTSLAQGSPTGPVLLPSSDGRVDAIATGTFGLTTEAAADPVLAAHQLLGRLAASSSLSPSASATAIRIDPSTVDPAELDALLTGMADSTNFLRVTTIGRLFQAVPAPADPTVLSPTPAVDLGSYPELDRQTRQLLASYQSMVPDEPELGLAFQAPIATTASADLGLAARRKALQAIADQLRSRFAGISTPSKDRVTLGARDARFPLPITSKLDEPVKVVISLEASDRLSFPDDTIETTLTSERTVVQIPVRTRATGDTPLRITVRTPDGGVILAESRYRVRSTAVSGVGVLLTVGAGGFLALWWGRHWIRTRRRRHRGRHSAAAM
ncbi:hypothetical protein BH10ACT1_BH10ACT1_06260 [soil metagenome]